MPRPHFILFFACTSILISCVQVPVKSPQEVLRNAVLKNSALESFSFTLRATIDGVNPTLDAATVDAVGVSTHRGTRFVASGSVKVSASAQGNPYDATLKGVFVVPSETQMYFRFSELSGLDRQLPPATVESLLREWFVMPRPESAAMFLTPSTAMIDTQAQGLSVKQDDGIQTINGRPSHHYIVTLDTARIASLSELDQNMRRKLADVSADGELWIDAESYHVIRAIWRLKNVATSNGMLTINADVMFARHNEQLRVEAPSAAQPLISSPLSIFDTFLHVPPLPE